MCRNCQHAGRGTNLPKKLAVGFANFLPIGNVRDEHAGANDIVQRTSRPLQRALNVLERLNGLRVGIACDELAIRAS